MVKKTILSGVTPTGNLHIGNYLGAIRNWENYQTANNSVYAMIADLHAITTPQEPRRLTAKTLEIAKLLVACGLDTKERSGTVIFVQSHVPAHTELAWILTTLTPMGELQRMTQFKEKKEKT